MMLRRGFEVMLAEANAAIETVSVEDLACVMDDPDVVLVDLRETVERERDGETASLAGGFTAWLKAQENAG